MNKVVVLDFGSQYTQLIARKIRELGIFSEIFPYNTSFSRLKREKPDAIILSGGPQSVYGEDAHLVSKELFEMGIPVLGICYGLQLMAYLLGGKVNPSQKREYGFASLKVMDRKGMLSGIKDGSQVWMSHGDRVERIPPGFIVSGKTSHCGVAVMEDQKRKFFGVQFHPEVVHTMQGKKFLSNFFFSILKLLPEWKMGSFIERKVEEIRKEVGKEKIICGLSGGVDSLVTSLLVQKAVQDNLFCIFIDNGLLRKGQHQELMDKFRKKLALNVIGVNAAQQFLGELKGVVSPERKRKLIGKTFIRIFEEEAAKIGRVSFLAQGTIYPDVIESNPVQGPSDSIKSHHNVVGGLPSRMRFELIEPLRELFKDEVRALASEMGVDRDFILQHPFPGPGLAVRIVGEITPERINLLQEADVILIDEIKKAGIYQKLWQAFVVLLPTGFLLRQNSYPGYRIGSLTKWRALTGLSMTSPASLREQ
jgi:GMP synthase (glutamine-hydrolysing)